MKYSFKRDRTSRVVITPKITIQEPSKTAVKSESKINLGNLNLLSDTTLEKNIILSTRRSTRAIKQFTRLIYDICFFQFETVVNDSDFLPLIKKIKIETVINDDDDNDEKFSPLESEKQFLDYDSDENNESDDEDDDSENKTPLPKYIYNYGTGKNNLFPLHAETTISDPDIFYFYKTRREPD